MKRNNEEKFKVGDLLVANIKSLKYSKAEVDIFSDTYYFNEIMALCLDNTQLLFEYIGNNKLMEANSKMIVNIEDEIFPRENLSVQDFYEEYKYYRTNQLHISSTALLPYDDTDEIIVHELNNGFEISNSISEGIISTIEEAIDKNDEVINELISESYVMANVENRKRDLNKAVKKYKNTLANPLAVEPKVANDIEK